MTIISIYAPQAPLYLQNKFNEACKMPLILFIPLTYVHVMLEDSNEWVGKQLRSKFVGKQTLKFYGLV